MLWRGAESSRVAELGDRKHATMDSQTPSRPAAAAAVVDGVRIKSSQSTSCQCDRLARNTMSVWTEEVLQRYRTFPIVLVEYPGSRAGVPASVVPCCCCCCCCCCRLRRVLDASLCRARCADSSHVHSASTELNHGSIVFLRVFSDFENVFLRLVFQPTSKSRQRQFSLQCFEMSLQLRSGFAFIFLSFYYSLSVSLAMANQLFMALNSL